MTENTTENFLARFTIRPEDDTINSKGNLLIGALAKFQNHNLLAPGVVYEIREVLGSLVIVPVGKSAIGMDKKDSVINVCWGNSVDQILDCSGSSYLLTQTEMKF